MHLALDRSARSKRYNWNSMAGADLHNFTDFLRTVREANNVGERRRVIRLAVTMMLALYDCGRSPRAQQRLELRRGRSEACGIRYGWVRGHINRKRLPTSTHSQSQKTNLALSWIWREVVAVLVICPAAPFGTTFPDPSWPMYSAAFGNPKFVWLAKLKMSRRN